MPSKYINANRIGMSTDQIVRAMILEDANGRPYLNSLYNFNPLPEAPFAVAFRNISVFDTVSGLEYYQGSGPSNESMSFQLLADGLSPSAGNITVTPDSKTEVYDGITWRSSAFTVPYTSGEISTASIYKIRLKSGQSAGIKNAVVSISGPGADVFEIDVSGEVLVQPEISVSDNSLAFGGILVGIDSNQLYFDVSAVGLTHDLFIETSGDFLTSLTNGSGYDDSILRISPVSGVVTTTRIYVIYAPGSQGSDSTDIIVSSIDASSELVNVTGHGLVPTITVSPTSIAYDTTYENEVSAEEIHSIEGVDLVDDIVITPPSGVLISLTSGSGYSSSPITLTPISEAVSPTNIYSVFAPSTAGSYSGNISHVSDHAATKNVSITGTSIVAPVITVSTNSLSAFADTTEGQSSSSNSFDVSAVALTDDLVITPPTDFTLSLTSGSGYSSSPITLTPSGGTVGTTTIYVKFSPGSTGYKSGNVACTSTGASTENVSVSGTGTSSLLTGLNWSYSLNGNANKNVGTNNGTASNVTYGTGISGEQSAIFTGNSNSNILIADSSDFTLGTNEWTISAWVKRASTSNSEQVFLGQLAASGSVLTGSVLFEFLNSKPTLILCTGGFVTFSAPGSITDTTTFHNIIATRSNSGAGTYSEICIYVDGVLVLTNTSLITKAQAINDPSSNMAFGRAGDYTASAAFPGAVCQANKWGRVLTSGEIATIASGSVYPF